MFVHRMVAIAGVGVLLLTGSGCCTCWFGGPDVPPPPAELLPRERSAGESAEPAPSPSGKPARPSADPIPPTSAAKPATTPESPTSQAAPTESALLDRETDFVTDIREMCLTEAEHHIQHARMLLAEKDFDGAEAQLSRAQSMLVGPSMRPW